MDFNAAVIGYPVEHSLSPSIHKAVYKELGFPWTYGAISAEDESAFKAIVSSARMDAMRASSIEESVVGFNITTPYKRLAFDLSDKKGINSEITGSANTIIFSEECDELACRAVLLCETTDGEGACRAIEAQGFAIEDARIMILGTGGAAMSIAASVLMHGAKVVKLVSRDPERSTGLALELLDRADSCARRGDLDFWGFGPYGTEPNWSRPNADRFSVIDYLEAQNKVPDFDIVINATPLGMNLNDPSPITDATFRKDQLVMDAVYAAGSTNLLKEAQTAGATAIGGLPMLVEQALLTIYLWAVHSGFDIDIDGSARKVAYEAVALT